MGAFNKKTIKVENPGVWKEGEYIKFRPRQNVSDQVAIRGALLELVPDVASLSNEDALVKYAAQIQVMVMQRMICGWCLFDDEGQEVELTPENVAELDGEYADHVWLAMSGVPPAVNNALSGEAQTSFLGGQKERTATSSK